MTHIGYARYGIREEPDGTQERTLKAAGCERVFTDHAGPGASEDRPALAACLRALRRGDRLSVTSFGRLALSARPLTALLADLAARGVVAVAEVAGAGTGPASGRLLAAILAAGDTVEAERRKGGPGVPRGRGGGRKPKLSPRQQANVRAAWDGGRGQSVKELAGRYRVSPNTIYRVLGLMPTR